MVELFFKKWKFTLRTALMVLIGLGYSWCAFELSGRMTDGSLTDGSTFEYAIVVFVWFSYIFLLFVVFCFVRSYVKCVIYNHPALVMTEGYLQVFDIIRGDDVVIDWRDIRTIEPFEFKGNTTYNVVPKDFDQYLLMEPSRWRRFCLRLQSLSSRGSIINIDRSLIDFDEEELLNLLNSHLQ